MASDTVWLTKSRPGLGQGTPRPSVMQLTRGSLHVMRVSLTRRISQHSLGSPPSIAPPPGAKCWKTMLPLLCAVARAAGNCSPMIVTTDPPSSGPNGGSTARILGVLSENHWIGRYGTAVVSTNPNVWSAGACLLVRVGTKDVVRDAKFAHPPAPALRYGKRRMSFMAIVRGSPALLWVWGGTPRRAKPSAAAAGVRRSATSIMPSNACPLRAE
mmetsp:Transcript_19998/g.49109  ORF Transcript_19998/g.49109 Transcript_19998/m.49109 type:complete len:214 (+) Transcript_19998:1795-2436(+)